MIVFTLEINYVDDNYFAVLCVDFVFGCLVAFLCSIYCLISFLFFFFIMYFFFN